MDYSLNISMFLKEKSFIDSCKNARKLGFSYIECWFPYEHELTELKKVIEENTLNLILINPHVGNTDEGDWGLASDLERVELFENTFQQALNYATGLGCQYINVLVGSQIHEQERNKQIEMLVKNLKKVAPAPQEKNITLLIESLNSYDFPGYLINTSTGGLIL